MTISTDMWTRAPNTRPPSASARTSTRTPVTKVDRSFRGDIEGLRAVAVLLVLLGHAGVPYLPGGFVGVDVFFVISGFLITGLLVEQLDRHGRLSLTEFYARRAKRLLPAATTVLVATLLLTYFFLPRGRWSSTAWDAVASAVYAMNWRMAAQSVDYVAANSAPSIFQHFWSLAVEEQFYLVWPLLLIVLGLLARRRGRGSRGLYLAGLALIAVPSFAWALHTSPATPAAYYVTTTRMWELALGGALAVAAVWLNRTPGPVAAILAWAGLVTIGGSAVLITTVGGFPGYAALGPTLGTAAVIAFGPAAGRGGPALLLARQPMRGIGAISYSLYLWHWPLLIAAQAYFGDLGLGASLGVVAASAIPATLTYHFIENPIRRSPNLAAWPGNALRVGALCTGVAVLAGLAFQLVVPVKTNPVTPSALVGQAPGASAAPTPAGPPGAAALGTKPRSSRAGVPVDRVDSITPDPVEATDDAPLVRRERWNSCHVFEGPSTPRACFFGEPSAKFRVALVGDSHADHWLPAMQGVAQQNGWQLISHTKSACPFIIAEITLKRRYQDCTEWNKAVRADLLGPNRPDLLITTHSEYLVAGESPENKRSAMVRELRRIWGEMTSAGIPVVVLRDTPYQSVDVAECVSKNPKRLTKCTTPRDVGLSFAGGPAQELAVDGLDGVRLIDLNDWICPAEQCAPVIGGVLVWRDFHHLTATYSATLAKPLSAALKPVVAELRRAG